MRNIRDILRLKLAGELSIRQIKASTKVSVGTIQKLLHKADELGLSWPLPEGLDTKGVKIQKSKRGQESKRGQAKGVKYHIDSLSD